MTDKYREKLKQIVGWINDHRDKYGDLRAGHHATADLIKEIEELLAEPDIIPLPALNKVAWEAYLQHRRDNKIRKLKPASEARLQAWLIEQGDYAVQAEIVNTTIRNGWTGLFELKHNHRLSHDQDSLIDALSYPTMRAKGLDE